MDYAETGIIAVRTEFLVQIIRYGHTEYLSTSAGPDSQKEWGMTRSTQVAEMDSDIRHK